MDATDFALLRGRFGRPYEHVDSTPSTQLLIPPEAPEGALVAAEEHSDSLVMTGYSENVNRVAHHPSFG